MVGIKLDRIALEDNYHFSSIDINGKPEILFKDSEPTGIVIDDDRFLLSKFLKIAPNDIRDIIKNYFKSSSTIKDFAKTYNEQKLYFCDNHGTYHVNNIIRINDPIELDFSGTPIYASANYYEYELELIPIHNNEALEEYSHSYQISEIDKALFFTSYDEALESINVYKELYDIPSFYRFTNAKYVSDIDMSENYKALDVISIAEKFSLMYHDNHGKILVMALVGDYWEYTGINFRSYPNSERSMLSMGLHRFSKTIPPRKILEYLGYDKRT